MRVTRALLIAFVSCTAAAICLADVETTTFVVVRHAEKAGEENDPPLARPGRRRARDLARALADLDVAALSATTYRRTIETLEPLAAARGLEIETSRVDTKDLAGWAQRLVEDLAGRFRGRTIVIAGHSNTVPAILDALGVAAPTIADTDYDDLFLVEVGGTPRLRHLHYGSAD